MKTSILVIILVCGCIVSSYSQMNQKRKGDMAAERRSHPQYDIKPGSGYDKFLTPGLLRDHKTIEGFWPRDRQYTGETQKKAFVQDSMPCYKPEGVFSARIIKPDSTIRHTMPVKKY